MGSWPMLNEWMERYEIELRRHRENNREKYLWGDEKMPEVLDRMRDAFARGARNYNKESPVILATCKHFGIPRTYTAIDGFIRGRKTEPK